MKTFRALCIYTALCVPLILSAHGTGRSVEKQVGDYLLDIGYNTETIVTSKPVYFDFKLYQRGPSPGSAPFDDVWVRVAEGTTTLFASGIAYMSSGETGMIYTFDRAGTYTMSVRYERGETALAETTFALDVVPETTTSSSFLYLKLLIGAVLACGAILLAYKHIRARGIL